MTTFSVLKDGKVEAEIVMASVDWAESANGGTGTKVHMRSGNIVVLAKIPFEAFAKAMREA